MLVWCAGVSLGLLADRFYGDVLDAYVLVTPTLLPEIGSSLCLALLPLLISALAVLSYSPALLCIAFLHGIMLGHAIISVIGPFGGAGMIVSALLLFRTVACTPILLLFWCTAVCSCHRLSRVLLVCIGGLALIAAADVWITAPFLLEVMNF